MSKILSAFFIFSLFSLTNCSAMTGEKDKETVRFALRDEYVASWEEKRNGIEVRLNEEGQRKLTGLTRTHPGSEMQIYAGRVLLTSETIHTTLHGQDMFVSIDDDVRECALAQLPPAKKV